MLNSSQENILGEKEAAFFPRCEYYTRYSQTSHFAMNEPKYWGTYFRSTGRGGESARFAQTDIKSKTYENTELNKSKEGHSSYNSHTGTFHNPYRFNEYTGKIKSRVDSIQENDEQDTNPHIHDIILNYKNSMCEMVVREFNNISKQKFSSATHNIASYSIYHHNNYPCVIVKLPFNLKSKNKKIWNKILIAYYIAIIDKKAEQWNVPIELVLRSSFGHNLPSIDVTGDAFRISIGLIPKIYINVIAVSLIELVSVVNTITSEIDKPLKNYFSFDDIESKNEQIKKYNKELKKNQKDKKKHEIDLWHNEHNCFDILNLSGDSKGQSIAYQLIRKRQYIDLFADFIIQELDKKEPNYIYPIFQMLNLLSFKKQVTMDVENNIFKRDSRKWGLEENSAIKDDNSFWELVSLIVRSIGGSQVIAKNRKVSGLYQNLEEANKNFIIHSIKRNKVNIVNDIGSDSECEGEIIISSAEKNEDINVPIHSRKIVVSTGMMAINLADYLSRSFFKQQLKTDEYRVDCKNMYYETKAVLSLGAEHKYLSIQKKKDKKNADAVVFNDLNHCDTFGNQQNRLKDYISSQSSILVLDYTSSTCKQIQDAIKEGFSEEKVKLILLVSSGLKNEQCGADNNPYGTIRIFCREKHEKEGLYDLAKEALRKGGCIPSIAHDIRRSYKQAGYITTNKEILSRT